MRNWQDNKVYKIMIGHYFIQFIPSAFSQINFMLTSTQMHTYVLIVTYRQYRVWAFPLRRTGSRGLSVCGTCLREIVTYEPKGEGEVEGGSD